MRFANTLRLSVLLLFLAGCVNPRVVLPEESTHKVSRPTRPRPSKAAPSASSTEEQKDRKLPIELGAPVFSHSLSLEAFLEHARFHHPALRKAEAEVEAARGRWAQAGLSFHPILGWQSSEPGDRANAGSKQGPISSLAIVTSKKLPLQRSGADRVNPPADWNAVTRYYEAAGRVRAAYFDALTAQREVAANAELLRSAQDVLTAAERRQKPGGPEVSRAKVERDQIQYRLQAAQRRADETWRDLTASAAWTDLAPSPLVGRLENATPQLSLDDLQSQLLETSSEIQSARARLFEGEELLRRTQAEPTPNAQIQLIQNFDVTGNNAGGQVNLATPIPTFHRSQGHNKAAEAEVARLRNAVRQTRLQLSQRLTAAFQLYETSRCQAADYEKAILPYARESFRLALVGYELGDPKCDYAKLLQAQNALAKARQAYAQLLNDTQRAFSDLEVVMQQSLTHAPG